MGSIRNIKKIFKSKPTIEGAGVHLKRAFGYSHVPLLDWSYCDEHSRRVENSL